MMRQLVQKIQEIQNEVSITIFSIQHILGYFFSINSAMFRRRIFYITISQLDLFVRVFLSIFQYNDVFLSKFQYNRVFLSIFQYNDVFLSIFQYSRMFMGIFQYSGVFLIIFQYSRVFFSIFEYNEVFFPSNTSLSMELILWKFRKIHMLQVPKIIAVDCIIGCLIFLFLALRGSAKIIY